MMHPCRLSLRDWLAIADDWIAPPPVFSPWRAYWLALRCWWCGLQTGHGPYCEEAMP